MDKNSKHGRRYSPEEKTAEVRIVRTLRLELVRWSYERSRATYGAPKVPANLTMEKRVQCRKKRIARIMRNAGIRGVCHQRKRCGWKPLPAPHDDLVKRHFTADTPSGWSQTANTGSSGFYLIQQGRCR